jgi:uncharacterized membrane protein
VAFVAVVVHVLAGPAEGLAIAVPALARAAALILSAHGAAAIAFVAGALGTLIGADLLNLGPPRDLGAGVPSIGGAGTFDGVFRGWIVGALLVGTRRESPTEPRVR